MRLTKNPHLPPLKHTLGEARLAGDWVRGRLSVDRLARTYPGDGRTVMVIPGLFTSDLRTASLRRALRNQEEMVTHPRYRLLFDPQTAGGLLASVPADKAEACIAASSTSTAHRGRAHGGPGEGPRGAGERRARKKEGRGGGGRGGRGGRSGAARSA